MSSIKIKTTKPKSSKRDKKIDGITMEIKDDTHLDTNKKDKPVMVDEVDVKSCFITEHQDNEIQYAFEKEPSKTEPIMVVEDKIKQTISSKEIQNAKLCLNMIVKNESKVIRRLLNSVAPYIDCYCISDTGSTDDTIDIIETFFANHNPPIPGKIIKEPFRDFGYNRSIALKSCEKIDVKYILLLDADMVLDVKDSTKLHQELERDDSSDVYYLFQGSPTFFYKNVRIVRNKRGYYYWGVTHEYVKTPNGTKYDLFSKEHVFINDIGDGGCKTDKFERDIRLLQDGLLQEPNNDRYTFYLANSFRDSGKHQEAINAYKKRIEIGGWFDEVWYSYYNIGNCYKTMGDMINAVHWWLEGYQFYPSRIENLYEIIHHYRCIGKNHIAYGFYLTADSEMTRNKNRDYLFLKKDIYDYKLDYELTIIGYYYNYENRDLKRYSMKVLNHPLAEDGICRNVFSNYKFYSKKLIDIATKTSKNTDNLKVLKTIGTKIPEIMDSLATFTSSTPSICIFPDTNDLLINVRYVDYFINDRGGYENRGTIQTKNVVALVDTSTDDWEIVNEFVLEYDSSIDNLYVGLEDVRLFSMKGEQKINYNCNRGLDYQTIKIECGEIDLDGSSTKHSKILEKRGGQNKVEKNWVFFENSQHQQKMVYGWHPLAIGDLLEGSLSTETKTEPTEFVVSNTIDTPHFFKHLRGSTNGVFLEKENEVWFLCHSVSYEDRRYYYHIFVVLDATTYQVRRYSPFFTFEKEKVEYTLGFVHVKETDEFLIGYSLMDKRTEYMMVPRGKVEEEMFVF